MECAGYILAIWLLAAGAAVADNRVVPPFSDRLNPLEERLFTGARDGQFQEFSLLEAALIASGCDDPADLTHYAARLDGCVAELRRLGTVRGTARQQAQAIFEFLHQRLLTGGYRLEGTDLRRTLEDGRFNCVSATVLFNCMADRFGLPVCGLESPGHAKSRLLLAEGPLDVETTCPRWFQLVDRPQEQAAIVEKTLGRPAAGGSPKCRAISPVQLVAMIYYNRGVDLLGEKRFDLAAAANAKAVRLDPTNATARGNFLATINNWAIELGVAERFEEAAKLLRLGLTMDPAYEAFSANYVHLCRQWSDRLCSAGRFEEAASLLSRAAAERPDEPYFRRAQAEVSRRWAAAAGEK
jgi:tetratricopeptide (TPR) repeat protein